MFFYVETQIYLVDRSSFPPDLKSSLYLIASSLICVGLFLGSLICLIDWLVYS